MPFIPERIFKGPGFAETLYLGVCEGQRIIRKMSNRDALPFSRTALAREIKLLIDLPDRLKPYFCKVIRTNLGECDPDSDTLPDPLFYDMPYYAPEDGWRTLSALFLENALDKRDAWRVIDSIMNTVFEYLRYDYRAPAPDYAERTMLRAIRESLSWAAVDSDFASIISAPSISLNGVTVPNCSELAVWLEDTDRVRSVLTPRRDRFLHGDFFPENILYNIRTGQWLFLDPVSVRGIHRGDMALDLNKMDDWLSGELPALRSGLFTVDVTGAHIRFELHRHAKGLQNLERLGVLERYRELLVDSAYSDVFAEEPGWEVRWRFVRAFYSFCMLPLVDKRHALARYANALDAMSDFLDAVGD